MVRPSWPLLGRQTTLNVDEGYEFQQALLSQVLGVGDITVFTDEGPEQIEVKTNAKRRNSVQNRRIKATRRALDRAGPLPGDDRGEWLYDLDLPYRTHLDLLAIGTERAAREGIFAAKVRGDRALLVTDFYGCQAQGWTEDQFNDQLERKFSGALRRAGLGPRQVHIALGESRCSALSEPVCRWWVSRSSAAG